MKITQTACSVGQSTHIACIVKPVYVIEMHNLTANVICYLVNIANRTVAEIKIITMPLIHHIGSTFSSLTLSLPQENIVDFFLHICQFVSDIGNFKQYNNNVLIQSFIFFLKALTYRQYQGNYSQLNIETLAFQKMYNLPYQSRQLFKQMLSRKLDMGSL